MSVYTVSLHHWDVVQRGDRWHCEQISNERMRLGADGCLSIGQAAPIRSYPFLTREWARACLHRMQEMDEAFAPQPEHHTLTLNTSYRLGVGASMHNQFVFRSSGRELVRIGQGGAIEHFDLPLLVWTWLRKTPLADGLKRLWHGERGQA